MKKLHVERTPDILVFELKAVTGYDPANGKRVLCVEKKGAHGYPERQTVLELSH